MIKLKMSQGVPQVVGGQQVVGGSVVQGQLMQSHVVHGQVVNSGGKISYIQFKFVNQFNIKVTFGICKIKSS